MGEFVAVPKGWVESFGELVKFIAQVFREIFGLRVFKFFGEALRQAGILIVGSTLVIWGLVFISGLECGIEGAYFNRSRCARLLRRVRSVVRPARDRPARFRLHDGREGRNRDRRRARLDADLRRDRCPRGDGDQRHDVPLRDAIARRLDGAAVRLPVRDRRRLLRQLAGGREQIGDVSSGGFFLIFWQFQNPPDLFFSLIKAMAEATLIVLVGCYYGYNASGGPVGVGTATAKSMVLNIVGVHLIGMLGTQLFWGANPRAPIGG